MTIGNGMTDYAQKGHYYIAEPRFELKKLARMLPASAHVLDMGAGNGNNTRFLLEAGFIVTAVEPNPDAVKDLKRLEKQYRGSLKVVEASIDTFETVVSYDAVVCCMVVHFMEGQRAGATAIKRLQSWTRPGGYNLLTGYLSGQSLPTDFSFLPKPGELQRLYKGWNVRWYQESYRLALSRLYSPKDIPRLLLGRRGYKAARIIAQKAG